MVKTLLSCDGSACVVNSSDEEGWAPLHSAASIGNLEIVDTLLSKGQKNALFLKLTLHIAFYLIIIIIYS